LVAGRHYRPSTAPSRFRRLGQEHSRSKQVQLSQLADVVLDSGDASNRA
jgi:hypothetical protein